MRASTMNLVNDVITHATDKGVIKLSTEDESYNGRIITINKKRLIHFGSCSYLGLEIDERLKAGAINAIQKYGIQFSSSRTYVSCSLYKELDELLRKIYNAPIALTTSTSLGHQGVLPVIIGENDAIIMDQQVHASVQDAANKLQNKGVTISVVRHNDLKDLRKKVEELYSNHTKIWYLIDGIYSMYGDLAPIPGILELLNSYKKLYLYADDAHGMSWCGKNGKGYVLSQVENHPKVVVASSLAKGFGVGGGVFVFPDEEICNRVKNCGGPFVFSGPHQIPVIGAAIASAKIHLSKEISVKQKALEARISYCNFLLKEYNLPVISTYNTPIFYIGLGLLRVGHNMVKRMIESGFYVNLGMFPAVPEACTGIRFTISLHHTFMDIKRLVKALAYHLPKALAEEERTLNDINRAFKKNNYESAPVSLNLLSCKPKQSFCLIHRRSISQIPKDVWNSLMENRGNFDWNCMKLLEETYSNNVNTEDNWGFHYYIISDENKTPVIATFFTITIAKDDMLSPEYISSSIEKERIKDKYYLTSKIMTMGAMVTEGDHLYVNKQIKDWNKALMMLIDEVWREQDRNNAQVLCLRDFQSSDQDISTFFKDQGFIKYDLPDNHLITNNQDWHNSESFLAQFRSDKRYYLKSRVFEYEKYFTIKLCQFPCDSEIEEIYSLYKNIASKKFEINIFEIPKSLFVNMAKSGNFDFILLYINDLPDNHKPVGMAINYKNNNQYTFLLTGIDYSISESYNVYPQILWQVIKRANVLGIPNISLGYTASQNKRKFGANTVPKCAFIQMKDNFNMSLLDLVKKNKLNFK